MCVCLVYVGVHEMYVRVCMCECVGGEIGLLTTLQCSPATWGQ